jgi:hypothetical protein
MKTWSRRWAATAAAVGIAAWAAGGPSLPALAAAGHADGMATNPYSPAYGHSYRKGAVPTRAQSGQMKGWSASHNAGSTGSANTLRYDGGVDGIGVTDGPPRVYLVFWGAGWGSAGSASGNTTFTGDYAGAAPYLQNMFKGIGTGELWSATMTQYCDGAVAAGSTSCPSGSSHVGYAGPSGALAGVWFDPAAEPSAASGNAIAQQAIAAAANFGNTTAASNRNVQYDILSAPGTNPDNYETQGFCAWHDFNGDTTLSGGAATSPYGDVAFTNMPYVADAGANCGAGFVNSGSRLDGFSIVNGHEFAETITDQNPAGGWINFTTGQENGDECAWLRPGTSGGAADVSMTSGSFAMQSTWSNDTNACAISHQIVGNTTQTNNFSIGVAPSSGSVTQSTTGSAVTVSTSAVSGSGTVALSTSTLPSGVTASFAPASVSAGGSSQLTFAASSTAATGTYAIAVTGSEGSNVHSTTYSLTVNPAGTSANAIVNGGFEAANFTGWTTSGAATNILTAPVHSGGYSAAGGYFSPTGISNIAQTFKAAAGNTHLTFWYVTTCSGSTASNYATVTLRDNTASTSATPVARSCSNVSTWKSVTVNITAGHSYTLTFTNRDSRTGTTYIAIDDVATS